MIESNKFLIYLKICYLQLVESQVAALKAIPEVKNA